jgi:hypothetical protein
MSAFMFNFASDKYFSTASLDEMKSDLKGINAYMSAFEKREIKDNKFNSDRYYGYKDASIRITYFLMGYERSQGK